MVKALFLGLLAATICGFVFTAPVAAPPEDLLLESEPAASNSTNSAVAAPPLEDPAARSERSTNLSHTAGNPRTIQMFINHRHLELLPNGTVSGTLDDLSVYTHLQRTTIGIGQMKIQGTTTCHYLCMDSCGFLYGSRDFGDECIFNETLEHNYYNTYSSVKYSNERRTLYLALNKVGKPRKVVVRAHHQLGKLSSLTRVLTRTLSPKDLHPMRHHGHVCTSPTSHQNHDSHNINDPPRCRKKRKKKKKKKRKCLEDEPESELCQKRLNNKAQHRLHKCETMEEKDSEVCQREVTIKNKHKLNVSEKLLVNVQKKKKKNKKGVRKRLDKVEQNQESTTTTTMAPISTTPPDDIVPDEDYTVDASTHSDWEDSTAVPDVSMAVSDAKFTAQPHTNTD